MDVVIASQARELDRQEIDKEIQDAYDPEVVRMLKTRRNAFAHISLLPTEILSGVFTTLVYSYSDHSDLSWIPSVTAVCGHWRAIALECPNLWCYIDFSRPIWVEEMLKRSKMAPLILKAHDRHPTLKQIDTICLALQHISRIKELHLTASQNTIVKLINSIDKPAPLLQSLHLSDSHYYLGDDTYIMPKRLFVCDGHHLQRLELINCRIPLESPLLCGLVHFKLYKSVNDSTSTQLLETLEKMPLIESLDLSGSLTFPSGDATRVIHLSHLTSLRLHSFDTGCANLLNHISFPASTSLALRCRLTTYTSKGYSTVCNTFSSIWNGKDDSKLLRCLLIRKTSTRSIRLRGWTTNETTGEHPSGPAQINVELTWFDLNIDNVIIDICHTLTLTSLRTLFVYDTDLSKATWLSAIGHLTLLRRVHLDGTSAFGLVSALSIGKESRAGNDAMERFLPGLHDLWINGRTFVDDVDFLEELRDCLMSRCHWNVEVRELHLLDCRGLYRGQVGLLEEIVVYVNWDGMDRGGGYADKDEYDSEDSEDSCDSG
jgi:hypothetical protein